MILERVHICFSNNHFQGFVMLYNILTVYLIAISVTAVALTIYDKYARVIEENKVMEVRGKISLKENEKPKILIETIKIR